MGQHSLDDAIHYPVTEGQKSLGWIPPWDPNYPEGGNPVPADVKAPWEPVQAPVKPITPDPVRQNAKNAAQHSLGVGLFITVLTGVATGLSAVPSGTNWFTRDGLVITGVVLANSVIHACLTYANRLGWGSPTAGGALTPGAEGTSDGECSS